MLMQTAKRCDSIVAVMVEQERSLVRVNRQNLKWLAMACERKLGRRGGQGYLAEAIRTNAPHISALLKGRDGRGIGPELKEKIERTFKLHPDWMDHEHPVDIVDWLVERVPSLPGRQIAHKPQKTKPSYNELLERLERLEKLEAARAQARNIPK